MDLTVLQLGLFLAATFFAALVAGVTGFAFALIAAAVWLHILAPLQTVTLTICYGLIVQGSRCCAGPILPPCAWASRHSWRCIRSTA